MRYRVVLIPGDGTGPEITEATVRVLEATGVKFEWVEYLVGETALKQKGTPLPDEVIEAIRQTKVALKGPITTPIASGFRSVNVALRKALNLYANIRPAKYMPGVKSRFPETDIVVIRENTEDLYSGVEYFMNPETAISLKIITREASERIVRFAFEYAQKEGRKKVTAVHKANILKYSDGLFLEVARYVAQQYPDIAFEDRIVDNMCMQLVQKPDLYDVLVLPNLYGDIISDLCAGLVGGLGVAPSGNIGDDGALFEAVHGSAPKYTGKNKVNPTALILTGAMMLKYLGEAEAALAVERAVRKVIAEGKFVTYDLKPNRDDPTAVGTSQMADAIVKVIKAGI